VLSIFPEWQQWNRDNISNYFDVYIKCDIDLLIKRDSKGLYKKAILGEIKNVVGIDLLFPEPSLTKLRIENNISYDEFISYADQIIQLAMET
jgi:adenylylsulfate kinase-like enzyme